jgi:hypothetical protein
MYIFWEENTNCYHKGQLAPFFIAILTILIIGIMVTVNIGKIAQIKTHTSNSADAGALAGASMMGTTFNFLGAHSSLMYAQSRNYFKLFIEESLKQVNKYTTWTIVWLLAALAIQGVALLMLLIPGIGEVLYQACLVISAVFLVIAAGKLNGQIGPMMKQVKQRIKDWHKLHGDTYVFLREMVDTRVDSARRQALSLGFSNSGVSSMLTEDQGDDYENFIEGLEEVSAATYSWQDGQDGQGRSHDVTMEVSLADVENYELYKTKKNIKTLVTGIGSYFNIFYLLSAAISIAISMWIAKVATWLPSYVGIGATAAATAGFYLITHLIKNGIQEGGTFWDSSGDPGDTIIIAIANAEHSRSLAVTSEQLHQGANLTLWQTEYPKAHSEAAATFSGGILDGDTEKDGPKTGKGHDPKLIEVK